MALDDLADCIELLRSRIRSHRTTLEENETRTRTVLIDSLLHGAGLGRIRLNTGDNGVQHKRW